MDTRDCVISARHYPDSLVCRVQIPAAHPRIALKEQVEEYIANLLSIGLNRERIGERALDYALALQTDQQQQGDNYVSATMMAIAAEWVKSALPGAHRIYERRNMMR